MTSREPIVIVGAGPAGLSAAVTLADLGLSPLLIDESFAVGGQIYRQRPPEMTPRTQGDSRPRLAPGASLIARCQARSDRIRVLSGAAVWGLFEERHLALVEGSESRQIHAEHLLLAVGAHEFTPPFPGWTLPGVMTPGAAQSLVKTFGVRPGRRVVLAGTGPFLLVVASELHAAGMEVVAVVEAARTLDWSGALPGLFQNPALLRQGWEMIRDLRRARIPLYRGHMLIEAEGDSGVSSALIAPCDRNWRPDRERARSLLVDTICVGYGFVPRVQLAQLAGCRLRYADGIDGWAPETDDLMETSVPGVWVAGDGGGVAGVLVAEIEGELAALAIARRRDAVSEAEFATRSGQLIARRRRLGRFRAALDKVSRLRPGLLELPRADTLVCRCEEITLEEVRGGIDAGGTTLRTLKVMTRLGMGPCQGRMCWRFMARYVANSTGAGARQIGPLSIRPPIKPVELGAIARSQEPSGAAPAPAGEASV